MIKRRRLLMQFLALPISTCLLTMGWAADTTQPQPSSQNYTTESEQPTSATTNAERNLIQLREMLIIYQNIATQPWQSIPDDVRFRLGHKNSYVFILRDHLKKTSDLEFDSDTNIFDRDLLQAVKNFQQRLGLKVDGVIGKATRAALNVPPDARVKQILVNMDRWEKLSHRLGHRYIMVNVPDYHLNLVENDHIVLSMKIIVGRPTRQTPEVISRITTIVFKPYWNVPAKLAENDIATKAMDDPDYLNKNNIHVYQDGDHGTEIDGHDVDWQSVAENGTDYHLRQDPGEKNSLGLVKFEFPNPYDVYLHDTPAKALFSEDTRDFSSGCVRLEKPFDLVAYLMKDDPNWNTDQMNSLLAEDKPTYVNVEHPLQVVITYLTAWIDENGKINFRDDVYGRDDPQQNDDGSNQNNQPEAD